MFNCGGTNPRRMPVGFLGIVLSLLISYSLEAAVHASALSSTEVAVQSGQRLEAEGRWTSAIEHYEAALEKWPDNQTLLIGQRRAKFQFAIQRRYQDSSYTDELLALAKYTALSEWESIYSQVSENYIDIIRPTEFVAHGTESLYLCLLNEEFLKHHGLTRDSSETRELRRLIRNHYWNRPVSDSRQAKALIAEVANQCRNRAGIHETAVFMEYIYGGANVLDKYSAVLTPAKRRDLHTKIDGELVGLGIEIKQEEGKGMFLVNVFPDSPAEEGGAKAGEHIVWIEGSDCTNMTAEEAANLLTGKSGSQVRLKLKGRDGQVRGPIPFTRRAIEIKSIPVVKMLDREQGIGYIKMVSFQRSTARELDEALYSLEQQGMKSLVWDVRGNPGGLLTSAIEVLDRFLDRGVIVSTKGRDRSQNWKYTAHSSRTWRMPLVLVVDENSASASEIAAGAIADHKRGLLVGRKSYGKWSVQTIMDGNYNMGLRLTTAKFFSPSDRNYSERGIEPDIEVELEDEFTTFYRGAEELDEHHDPDIAKAVGILRTPSEYQTALSRGYARTSP